MWRLLPVLGLCACDPSDVTAGPPPGGCAWTVDCVGDQAPADAEAWTALRSCRTLDGTLTVSDPPGADTVTLPCLEGLSGDLTVTGTTSLTTLELPALVTMEQGRVVLQDNASLVAAHAAGLDGLAELDVVRNPALVELGGWVPHEGEIDVNLASNASLNRLDALREVGSVGALTLTDLPQLSDLGDLAQLERVGSAGDLRLSSLPAIGDLEGLAGLTSVEQDLWIVDNDALQTLDGLRALRSAAVVIVADNALLCDAEVDDALAGIDTQATSVTDNGDARDDCP